ncbi:MAG TPA: VOC family protein [Vicinamibacterales bacterium]
MSPSAMQLGGYGAVTPYLILSDAAAIDFYKRAFGATERMRMQEPGSRIMHAELTIGGSIIMLADEAPEMDIRAPQSLGGSPVSFVLYVDAVDVFAEQAITHGLTVVRPIEDKPYGDRMGTFADPFGYQWHIATPISGKVE